MKAPVLVEAKPCDYLAFEPAAATAAPGAAGAAMEISIFDNLGQRRKAIVLFICACSTALVPISDTIYLPALSVIEKDLRTTATMTAASVSVYMFAMGLGALLLGPMADRLGRRPALWGSTAVFTALAVACIFAPTIKVLLALRALQGFAVSGCSTTSNAILADIYAPEERGRAMGVAAIPFLVGPVIGPLVGGGLSQSLGWRSTFVALSIMGAVVLIGQLALIPETHHYFVVQMIRELRGDEAAAAVREEVHPLHFDPPYRPLMHLLDKHIAVHAALTVMLFSTMFSAMIVLPIVLSQPPYNFSEGLVGVANGVPFGMGGLLAAPLGGFMADWGARRWGRGGPAGRMVFGTVMALLVYPPAVMLFAWGMHFRLPAVVPLIGGFFINASMTSHMPATMSLISIWKQRYAAAAGGGLHAMQFIIAGVFVQVTPMGVQSMGVGPYMTMVTGITLAVSLASLVQGVTSLRRAAAGDAGEIPQEVEDDVMPKGHVDTETGSRIAMSTPSSPVRSPVASLVTSPSKPLHRTSLEMISGYQAA